jgi:hypothetical protein
MMDIHARIMWATFLLSANIWFAAGSFVAGFLWLLPAAAVIIFSKRRAV